MPALDPTDPKHAVIAPIALGYVRVSNGRHRGPGGLLGGAPPNQCLLNDPDAAQAEYLYPDRQSAATLPPAKIKRLGLTGIRHSPEIVAVEVEPAPSSALAPAGAVANAHSFRPPPTRTVTSQQYGMIWADAGWQGVETSMPDPPPIGSENRLSCIFLGRGAVVRVRSVIF